MTQHTRLARLLGVPALVAVVALLAIACGGGSEATPTTEVRDVDSEPATADGDAPAANAGTDSGFDFPTGEPVLVAADYVHPDDRVDNTGRYLPTNGKPTVVFVDAIW